jgi:hypothetical protein
MTLLCSIDEPRFDNGKTEYLMWFADVLQHHAGHGLIGMLLHVLEEVCRLPATEAFQFDNPCSDNVGLAVGFSEAKPESTVSQSR